MPTNTKAKKTAAKKPAAKKQGARPIDSFVAIILANGRPDRCLTFNTLRASGYTGRIIVLIDNEDKTRAGYEKNFGVENVVVFNKAAIAKEFRNADNFMDLRSAVYARNASFKVAKQNGYRYFMQLDDDYTGFRYRCDEKGSYHAAGVMVRNLDDVFLSMLDFYKESGCLSVAMSQGGDHLGGAINTYFKNGWPLRRKIMNSWLCDTERPFTFEGRMNDDVGTYVRYGARGELFFTFFQVMLNQVQTQAAAGGMSETYASSGTYVKSFYTVMMQPSSVKISEIGVNARRLHHAINWRFTIPKLLHESHRKA